ncbi:MAG: AraC family transcriptional regulator [Myxococcales bacterium]|nr:AraC family transcriptional regulator [Myxococcales bacterium]
MGGTAARRVELVRHEEPGVRWELAKAPPHPALAGLVREYSGYVESAASPIVRRELPTTDVPLIINLGGAWGMVDVDGGEPEVHDSFVAGFHDTFARLQATGPAHCLQVDFTPVGAYRFLGQPMHLLAGSVEDLDAVMGGEAAGIGERLKGAADWAAAFDLLDAFILERIERHRAASRAVRWAWQRLQDAGGALSIADLSAELGWSRKHLRARFREEVGATAKIIAQVLRFNRVLEHIQHADDEGGMAALALGCGYADQAHMSREFRRFAGLTPREYRRIVPPDGVGIVES